MLQGNSWKQLQPQLAPRVHLLRQDIVLLAKRKFALNWGIVSYPLMNGAARRCSRIDNGSCCNKLVELGRLPYLENFIFTCPLVNMHLSFFFPLLFAEDQSHIAKLELYFHKLGS